MNGDKINGRTPDEIKKALECRVRWRNKCDLNCSKCDVFVPGVNWAIAAADALAYIQQLERERDQYKREIDAFLELLKSKGCDTCKYEEESLEADSICVGCHYEVGIGYSGWQWRGVQEEK